MESISSIEAVDRFGKHSDGETNSSYITSSARGGDRFSNPVCQDAVRYEFVQGYSIRSVHLNDTV